ncbi:FMRFamide receptor [Portunus trituberculatus]|uniref:FMRFamide receptor n=1 Tax=Portunus trituberculatus TaxID=210409 RepID=A0A5B7I2D3_PORTR|nr:FMRFamide receptor [Portunus trituberculatus]
MEAEEVVEVVEEVVGNLSLTRDEVTGNLSLGEGMGLRAVDVVQAWVTPALVTVGVTGNVASVLVLSSPKLRALSSSCYLSALAASDTGFLAALLLSWLTLVGHDLYGRPGWCQGIVYATYVTTFLSVWLVVAFTVERFVAVCYPLLRHAVCTVRRARMVVLCLVVTALALYSYLLVVAAPVPHEGAAGGVRCQVRPAYLGVAGAMNHLDTVLALLLPVLTIVTLNVQIARCVWRVERLRSSMTQQGCGDGPDAALGPEPRARQGQGPGPRRGQHKVTKMLLVISTVFISLNLPSYCMRAYVFFWVSAARRLRNRETAAPREEKGRKAKTRSAGERRSGGSREEGREEAGGRLWKWEGNTKRRGVKKETGMSGRETIRRVRRGCEWNKT